MPQCVELERLTQAYGRELLARMERPRPVVGTPAWWDERLWQGTLHRPALKYQLFRFIDVLPQLSEPAAIGSHLCEYLRAADGALPGWLHQGLRWLPRWQAGMHLVAYLARAQVQRLARRFIAGACLEEALQVIDRLRQRQLAFTVDLLGEATLTEVEAQRYQQGYLELLAGLSAHVNHWPTVPRIDEGPEGPLPRVHVSLKLSSLYSQFDPLDAEGSSQAVRQRLRPILRAARQQRAFVNIDMEQYAYKDLTLRIFRQVLDEEEFRDWPDVGIAIQAYLPDSAADLEALADWVRTRGTPIWVRLVKGAYWDYETVVAAQRGWPVPVFTRKADTDANYERLSRFLLAHHQYLHPAFGSHNVRSLAHALAAAEVLGVPAGAWEFQMLYGMAEELADALVSLGQRVRIYTPYGPLLPGMAYLVRRLLENTANESFLRAHRAEHLPEEKLLMNPLHLQEATRIPTSPAGVPSPPTAGEFRNEPPTDFSREEARQAMRAALAAVGRQLGKDYPLVLAGQMRVTGAWLESLNPAHRKQQIGRCARAGAAEAAEAVAAARQAFPAWRDTDPEQRADYLRRAAAVLRRRRLELAAWQVYECAKPWREADADVAEAIDYCEYYAAQMRRLARPRHWELPGEANEYRYEPRGVAVVIAPWNFPLAIPCGMATAALVTGNPVILKPAEQSSVVAAKLLEVFQEAGFPPGVINYLPGIGEEIGPLLVRHPEVALVAFTGSQAVGRSIYQAAAETPPGQQHLKRVIVEMGGKNAILIDDDADLDEAVRGVVDSAFGYQGQKCSACSRVIVLEGIYEPFLERLIEATRSLKVGPPEDPATTVGPLIDAEAQQRVQQYIAQGKQEARLVYAGQVGDLAQEGYYVAPHIFAEVPPRARIAQEEIFGPVLAVLRARDLDEALSIANGTVYALTGGFYSRSPERIRRVCREFRVGNLYINRKITGALVGRQPFGGFKLSGGGTQAGGPDYLLHFLWPRTITENTLRRGFAPPPAAETPS